LGVVDQATKCFRSRSFKGNLERGSFVPLPISRRPVNSYSHETESGESKNLGDIKIFNKFMTPNKVKQQNIIIKDGLPPSASPNGDSRGFGERGPWDLSAIWRS